MSPQRACAALLALSCAAACANDPYPTQAAKRTDSEEIFFFVCKRVARETAEGTLSTDLSGAKYDAACDGKADPDDLAQPRLSAMVRDRPQIIAALEQTVGDQAVTRYGEFDDGEIKAFLKQLVPFYDDDTLPGTTQKIAALLDAVLDESDPRATAVIDRLAAISPRMGYRPSGWALGAIRPFLSYERLDALSKTMLKLFGEGGDAHEEFVSVLKAAALELADEAAPVANRDDTTLHVLLDLLLTPDPTFAASGDPKLYTVRRDARGLALTNPGSPFVDANGDGLADVDSDGAFVTDGKGASSSPYPFKLARGEDPVQDRDGNGLALSGSQPMFQYYDANSTVLAAGMREAKSLLQRDKPGEPSTVENVGRGLRALLGTNTSRAYKFGTRDYVFQGPDVSKAPVLDLVHVLGTLLKQPETREALELVNLLMKTDDLEAVAAAPLYAGLQIDARADKHPEAEITGVDGKPGSPHEFWDDALFTGSRILKRDGLLLGLIDAFAQPLSSAQGQLFGDWMQYNDVVTYKNAPFTATGPDGKFTDQEKADLNAPLTDHRNGKLVDRTLPDTGMNRSIWQRTMSLLHTINGSKLCNKEGATLSIKQPLPLTFPSDPAGYKRCDFVEIQDPGEAYVQALLKRLTIVLKDAGLTGLAGLGSALGIVGTTSEIQEQESQITGFNASPTGEAMARFMFGPANAFTNNLFGDIPTNDGVPLKLYEPYALFPMEILNDKAMVDGKPQSFISAGMPLITAFDDHELRDADKKLPDGYMFGHFLDLFHMHWAAPKAELCPDEVVPGSSEGCTQRLDVTKKFWSPQSNLVSYEPLITEAMVDEQLTVILQKAASKLKDVKVTSGKSGQEVLANFVTMLLNTSGKLAYRDGRKWSMTNTCTVNAGAALDTPPEQCNCPKGATDDGAGNCSLAGSIVPRGKIRPISPAYMLLDALKGLDNAFAKPEFADRLKPWRAARSALVDRFLGAEKVDAANFVYKFSNQNSRKVAVKAIEWAIGRIDAHQVDLEAWADGLPDRTERVLSHPLVASALDVLDKFWAAKDAGDEFAAVASYLMDPSKDAFDGIVVATADTITFVDREPELTPIVRFASLAVAPNAFQTLDADVDPNVADGVLYQSLELTRKVVDLHTDDSVPSPISKLLKNLVLVNDADGSAIEGESPIETIFDSVAEINRTDASQPENTPMAADDQRSTLSRLSEFLKDKDRGLERIYSVIKSRNLDGQVQ